MANLTTKSVSMADCVKVAKDREQYLKEQEAIEKKQYDNAVIEQIKGRPISQDGGTRGLYLQARIKELEIALIQCKDSKKALEMKTELEVLKHEYQILKDELFKQQGIKYSA